MNAAVFSRNIGISGTCSTFINVAARSRASALGSANVPLVAYTSIIGMVFFSCFLADECPRVMPAGLKAVSADWRGEALDQGCADLNTTSSERCLSATRRTRRPPGVDSEWIQP
jgi:hypothetical protein